MSSIRDRVKALPYNSKKIWVLKRHRLLESLRTKHINIHHNKEFKQDLLLGIYGLVSILEKYGTVPLSLTEAVLLTKDKS